MLHRRAVIALALAFLPVAALACGPTRQKKLSAIEIEAPADKVWGVVGNYKDMSWHDAIAATSVDGDLKPDVTKRTLTFKTGKTLTDGLTEVDDANKQISFMTENEDKSVLPVTGYASRITVTDIGGKTLVEWRGAFVRGDSRNEPAPELNDDAAIAAVTAFQIQGLQSLKKKIESGS